MKVVLDTNVVISGLFFSGLPDRILRGWRDGRFELVVSPEILDEYRDVSERLEAKHPGVSAGRFLQLLLAHATMIDAPPLPQPTSEDQDDDMFLACALAGRCAVIVSGDRHLLDLTSYRRIEILTPRQFVDRHLEPTPYREGA